MIIQTSRAGQYQAMKPNSAPITFYETGPNSEKCSTMVFYGNLDSGHISNSIKGVALIFKPRPSFIETTFCDELLEKSNAEMKEQRVLSMIEVRRKAEGADMR